MDFNLNENEQTIRDTTLKLASEFSKSLFFLNINPRLL